MGLTHAYPVAIKIELNQYTAWKELIECKYAINIHHIFAVMSPGNMGLPHIIIKANQFVFGI